MPTKHAAITIVSKNYFAFATTLAESYKKHHPDHDFLIVLVDKADGHVPASLSCGAEVIEMANLVIPDIGRFIYRYSIMELNTAVKPFALADIFEKRGYETLLYIDPDILVFRPLAEIYDALQSASIVLTPHIRKPYYDDSLPSDLTILQSGTYNLGFIGLRNTSSSAQMLNWWMTKLYRDCIVDIANGLFVDQKWIDLIPGFFPDHKIVYGSGYNAAYWNLHERRLTYENSEWLIDGQPLSFFHFSGYIPFAPQTLSKHQNRHRLDSMPILKRLTDLYGATLVANGYEESSGWPYAFETLPNGVPMPLGLIRQVMQWASRAQVATPCPIESPTEFCRFLMSRGVLPNRRKEVLLFHFLIQLRNDVAVAFPNAGYDHDDKGFREWVNHSGVQEYGFQKLLQYEDRTGIADWVADAFHKLRKANRQDIFNEFRSMWSDSRVFDEFADWFTVHGSKQLRCSRSHTVALKRAQSGIGRILNVYFLRVDVQARFPILWDQTQVSEFTNWLHEHRYELELSSEEVSLFHEFALVSGELTEKMRLLYFHKGQRAKTFPNIYAIDDRRHEIASALSTERVLSYLYESDFIEPADHYLLKLDGDADALNDFGRCSIPGLDPRKNFAFVKHLRENVSARQRMPCLVNYSGYLSAQSGMGESARSMRATLEQSGVVFRGMALPHLQATYARAPTRPDLFGWPMSCADVSITVANPDSAHLVESFLPQAYWAGKNVGYWVWETEDLPLRFKMSQRLFDEIWTPSQYAADAISRTVDCPVRVLPHTLDAAALDGAQSNRQRFGLPQDATLFGFMFDPQSVIERKNVGGLIKAFREAFRDRDNCYLVLKVNGKTLGAYDYEMIRAAADWDRILFVEATLSRSDTFDFIKSLDAYVSLHRSEGFGLTCAVAMALGLPVIASNYSGNLEFMTDDNSLLIPVKVIQTDRPYGAYPAGTCWGDPNLDAAVQAMRSMQDKARRMHLGKTGMESVRITLDKARIGAVARAMIEGLRRNHLVGNPLHDDEANTKAGTK